MHFSTGGRLTSESTKCKNLTFLILCFSIRQRIEVKQARSSKRLLCSGNSSDSCPYFHFHPQTNFQRCGRMVVRKRSWLTTASVEAFKSISLPLLETKLAKRRIFGATIPDRPGFHGGLERNASNPTCSLPLPGRHRWTSALTGQGRQRPRQSHKDFIKNEANCTDLALAGSKTTRC